MLALLAVAAAVTHCQPASIGPGSLHHGGTVGATCLRAAFQNGCKPADYTLSAFGVDTIHSRTFRTQATSGGCRVVVTDSFRVVPQPPRVTIRHTCRRVRAYVADRCTPAATISLTTMR